MGPTPVLDKYKLHPAGGYCTCKMHAGSICPACTRVRQHSANWEGLTPQLLQLANAEYDRKYNRTPESGDCIRAYFFRSLIMPDFDPNLKAYSLVELGAQLLIRSGNDSWVPSPSVPEAQGLMFLCPKCYHENHREDCGVHSVVCWFRGRGVPDYVTPGPGRWTPQGRSILDLSFVPGTPPIAHSVKLESGCQWHGFITNGQATLT
jgi:hypothetical protein